MNSHVLFIINSILLGFGLAMDAFSVSVINGLKEPYMKKRRMCFIAGLFALFQAAMPLIGWVCVHTILQYFKSFSKWIPWIALILLAVIGSNMLREAIQNKDEEIQPSSITFGELLLQGIATSIDALSVGFTIAEYGLIMAIICALIIGISTFFICLAGLSIGKKFGTRFSKRAFVFGGVLLILIGLEIIFTSLF